jgi:peptide/nickel transport system substrate-binding protein
LTSADVAYTLKRILDPKTASGGASLIADLKATGIATPDPTTVKLTLDRPNAFLPVSLAWINFGIVPDGTTDFAKGIGSGPFTLVRFETGASAQYARYDSYFKDGRPYLDGLQVVGAADEAAQVQAALSGQADLLHLVPFNQIQQVEASADVEVFELGGGQWPTFAARTTEKPFNDPRVVEALKLAVDREKFSTVAYAGRATPSADVPIPADDVFYPEGLEPREYDPERAKALLAEAGFRDGLDLELFTRAAGGFLSNATALKSIVEPAGIRIKLNNWPADTYWDKVWLKQPFCTDVWGRTHASYILPVAYGSKGSSNETAYSNPEFDKLVQDAARSTDVEEQKRYFGEAITLLHETSGSITPVHVPVLMAKSKRLQGLVPDWGTRAYLEDAYLA